MPADLLFELGCEEIPAKMLAQALAELPAPSSASSPPRASTHESVARARHAAPPRGDRQGPRRSAARSRRGGRRSAGRRRVRGRRHADQGRAGLRREERRRRRARSRRRRSPGKKGLYVVAQRHVAGAETRALLPDLLARARRGDPVAEVACAGAGARPRSCARCSGSSRCSAARSSRCRGPARPRAATSRGHRFLSHRADRDRERRQVRRGAARRARRSSIPTAPHGPRARRARAARAARPASRVRPDEALLDEVIHLGEYPVGVSGSFDPAFLEVPEEIIVTAMRTHQRYFAMEDASGKLAPRFATMMATIVKDPAVVAQRQRDRARVAPVRREVLLRRGRKKTFDDWNEQASMASCSRPSSATRPRRSATRSSGIVGDRRRRSAARDGRASTAARYAQGRPRVARRRRVPRGAGHDGQALRADRGLGRRGRRSRSSSTGGPRGRAPRCRRPTRPRSSRSPIAWTRSSAASPSGSSRAARPIRSVCAARRSASGRSCSTRGWHAVATRAFAAAPRRSSPQQGVTLEGSRKPLDEFFRARLRGIFVDQRHPARRTPTRRSRRTSRDPVDARARALALREDPQGSARGVQARRQHPRRRARQEARDRRRSRDPAKFVADTSSTTCTPRSRRADARASRARQARLRGRVRVAREAAPDRRRVLRQGRRHGHGSRSDASRQPARAAQLVHRAVHRDRRLPSARQVPS